MSRRRTRRRNPSKAVVGLGALALVGLGVLAMVAAAGGAATVSALTLAPTTLAPGITYNAGTVFSPRQIGFLNALRARLSASTPLHVTSATRTASQQASAMLTKYNLGDDLPALYGSKVASYFLAAPKTVADWTKIVEAMKASGMAFTSGHLIGNATDIRNNNLTATQRAEIVAAAKAVGAGKCFEEATPPHIHAEGFERWA